MDMNEVHFVDTTLRDGQASLWAENMRTGMMLAVAERMDNAGYHAIEVIASSHIKKCVRELRENPFERMRLVAEAERAVSAVFAALQRLLGSPSGQEGEAWDVMSQLPKDLKKLWMEAGRKSGGPSGSQFGA